MTETRFDVFISHKKQDKVLIKPIVNRLLDEFQIRCWFDEWDLTAGENWEKEIDEALRTCACCTVFLGEAGWGDYHLKEAQFALSQLGKKPNFTVIPVLLPGATEKDMRVLEDLFFKTHRVDLSNGVNDDNAFRSLRAAVKSEPQGPPSMTAFIIQRDASRWASAPSGDKSLLYRGRELEEAQLLAARFDESLNKQAKRFLAESAADEQKNIQRERRRTRIAFLVLGVLIAGLLGSTIYAFNRRSEASRQAKIANEQSTVAKNQTRIAERQTQIAEAQTHTAEQATDTARRERQKADSQRDIATQQRNLATQQRDRAMLLNYVGQMKLVQEAHDRNDGDRVIQVLNDLRPKPGETDLRSFDWNYFWKLYNKEMYTSHQVFTGKDGALFSDYASIPQLGFPSNDRIGILMPSPHGEEVELKLLQLNGKPGKDTSRFFPIGAWLKVSGNWQKMARFGYRRDETQRKTRLEVDIENLVSQKSKLFKDFPPVSLDADWNNPARFATKYDAISGDGSTLAIIYNDASVEVINTSNGEMLSKFNLYFVELDDYSPVELSANGDILAVGLRDGNIGCWNTRTGKAFKQPEKHQSRIDAIGFSPDGKIMASGDNEGIVKLWDIDAGKPIPFPEKRQQHAILATKFSPDGRTLAIAGFADEIKLWDWATSRNVNTFRPRGLISNIAFSPNGEFLASGGEAGELNIWRIQDYPDQEMVTPDEWLGSRKIAISADGALLAFYGSDTISIVARSTGKTIEKIALPPQWEITCLKFSPMGTRLAVGGKYSSPDQRPAVGFLYDTRTGNTVSILKGHKNEITALAFTDDGETLATGSFDALFTWNATNGERTRTLCSNKSAEETRVVSGVKTRVVILGAPGCACNNFLAFSPDKKSLASTGLSAPTKIWDLTSGAIRDLTKSWTKSGAIAYSHNGNWLAYEDDAGNIDLWDTRSNKQALSLVGSKKARTGSGLREVHSIAFSQDDKIVATGSDHLQVTLWNTTLGQELTTLTGNNPFPPGGNLVRTQGIKTIQFTPRDSALFTVSYDGVITLYGAKNLY